MLHLVLWMGLYTMVLLSIGLGGGLLEHSQVVQAPFSSRNFARSGHPGVFCARFRWGD